MEIRKERGKQIASFAAIVEKPNGMYVVPSQAGDGRYWVRTQTADGKPTCTCKDFGVRGMKCKHIFAVEFWVERERNADGSETVTTTVQVKERITYKQDWPAYNAAQVHEKDQFQVLLADLCRRIPEPVGLLGRRRLLLSDMVFAAAFKVYSTFSARRFASDLRTAHEKGHISRVPHFNSVLNYLDNPELTPILRGLIVEASLPLRSVEVDFAVDSSGFTTCRFVRWYDHKYNVVKQEHDWVKVHMMCGVKTNIVTAVEIRERHAGDSPQFQPLLATTARNFTIREVSADAAYASYGNMEAVDQLGATPYIDFRSNATAAQGGIYKKMFHYYNLNRDEFLAHYHKRSNIESTNAMIKAKFGDSLRSKTDVAMVNEALCKVLCHNLCCVIQSMHELGIKRNF